MRSLEDRKIVILGIFIIIGVTYLIRLFYLQVIDETYKLSAKNQALRYVVQYAPRGLIYDRNNQLLVYNEAAYDIMVIPRQVKNIDTLGFCNLLGIEKADFDLKMEEAKSFSTYKASVFEKQIPSSQFASISEKLYQYNGFYIQKRTLRKYPKPIASHVLGYVSVVSPTNIAKDKYYRK